MTSDEIDEYWNRVFRKSRLVSVIPPSDYMSSDLTEAYISLRFWIDTKVIRKMEEHELIRYIYAEEVV